MSEEKTRILPRKGNPDPAVEPRVINGQIMFFCPAGHRLAVPVNLAGKRGKCGKCGVFLQIPDMQPDVEPGPQEMQAEATEQAEGEEPALQDATEPPSAAEQAGNPAEALAESLPPLPTADAGEWSFVGTEPSAPPLDFGVDNGGESNPTARLVARLWAERNHGGIIELHLVGGNVILPEEFAARWSRGTHGLFASQAVDGTVTLTAVAWDTIQRIVVRQLAAVPDDMFE